jgi:hypothetical protein
MMRAEEIELPPDAARTIEGLRDTGYEFLTAVADIVDNSIEAGASRINVRAERALDGEIEVTVADNGIGMDEAALVNAMKYGSRARENLASLGKFGLGLKTASTAMCRRLTVITRPRDSNEVISARWDLDHVAAENKWLLQRPVPSDFEVRTLEDTAATGSGTVVVWQKVDRLLPDSFKKPGGKPAANALNRQVDALRDHLALTYVRFLDGTNPDRRVRIFLNGTEIQPWDPFGDDLGSEPLYDQQIPVVIRRPGKEDAEVSFRLRAFVLPPQSELDEAQRDRARINTDYQGFYVFRENRVISRGGWLGMFRIEPHFNLARIDFSFDHRLDDALHIDIKKSQIRLLADLHDFVKGEIRGARFEAEQRYRKNERGTITAESAAAHATSNAMIGQKADRLSHSSVEVTGAGQATISNPRGQVRIEIPTMDLKAGGPHVVVRPDLEDGLLWRPGIVDGKKAVLLNAGHDFYRKVYLATRGAPVAGQGLDFLLWSLSEAELAAITEDERDHMSFVRREVSRIVRELSKDLPEVTVEDE